MDVYNALLADDAKDRKKLYRDLQKELEATQNQRAEIATRAGAMSTEAETLFKSWGEFRRRDRERKPPQAERGAPPADEGVVRRDRRRRSKGATALRPGHEDDQVKYLGHDLNPQALATLKPDAEKLNKKVEELGKAIDDTITTANTNINAIRPQ